MHPFYTLREDNWHRQVWAPKSGQWYILAEVAEFVPSEMPLGLHPQCRKERPAPKANNVQGGESHAEGEPKDSLVAHQLRNCHVENHRCTHSSGNQAIIQVSESSSKHELRGLAWLKHRLNKGLTSQVWGNCCHVKSNSDPCSPIKSS